MKITKDRIIFIIIILVLVAIVSSVTTYAANYLYNSSEVSYDNKASNITSDNVQGAIDELYTQATNYTNLRNMIYPVGSIYISVTDDTVAKVQERFGGTWESFGQGRTLVGVGTGKDSNSTSKTFAINETAGEYTHTLTVAEMPSHNHNITYTVNLWGQASSYGSISASSSSGANRANIVNNSANSLSIGNTGGGGSHNNIQPYITVYMYKRIS